MKTIYIIGGGTMVHVAPHFSLCAPAYGTVVKQIFDALYKNLNKKKPEYSLVPILTQMTSFSKAGFSIPGVHEFTQEDILNKADIKKLETNHDLEQLISFLLKDENTRSIILATAVCDFEPESISVKGSIVSTTKFGKAESRLSSNNNYQLNLKPSDKLVKKIRENRKDVFLVSFKTTAGKTKEETYAAGLRSLKTNSSNIVFGNDVQNHHNVIITPEEFPYYYETRSDAINDLAKITLARINLSFTRTRVIPGEKILPQKLAEDGCVPENFIQIMRFLIENKAFKKFNGKTSGHFGCKVIGQPYTTISSARKTNHNNIFTDGMVKIYGLKDGMIEAEAVKPSVGEHTQQKIYETLGDKVDAIVHFHCEKLENPKHTIPERPQFSFECGSHQCADNTANGMIEVEPGIFAVHLEGHGPNIAFNKNVPVEQIIEFIKSNWNLAQKSGGNVV